MTQRECLFTGRPYEKATFNEEHVIPKWLLTKFDLFNKTQNWVGEMPISYRHVCVDALREANSAFGRIEDNIRNGIFKEEEVYLWAMKIHIGLIARGGRLRRVQSDPTSFPAIPQDDYGDDIGIFRQMYLHWSSGGNFANLPGSVWVIDSPYRKGVFDFHHCLLSSTVMVNIGEKVVLVALFDYGSSKKLGVVDQWKQEGSRDLSDVLKQSNDKNYHDIQAWISFRTFLSGFAYGCFRTSGCLTIVQGSQTMAFIPKSMQVSAFDQDEYVALARNFGLEAIGAGDEGQIFLRPKGNTFGGYELEYIEQPPIYPL